MFYFYFEAMINCIFWFDHVDRFSIEYYIIVIWCSPLCYCSYKLSFTETNFHFKLLVYRPLHLIIFHLWHSKILGFLLINVSLLHCCLNWFFQMTIKLLWQSDVKFAIFIGLALIIWQPLHMFDFEKVVSFQLFQSLIYFTPSTRYLPFHPFDHFLSLTFQNTRVFINQYASFLHLFLLVFPNDWNCFDNRM